MGTTFAASTSHELDLLSLNHLLCKVSLNSATLVSPKETLAKIMKAIDFDSRCVRHAFNRSRQSVQVVFPIVNALTSSPRCPAYKLTSYEIFIGVHSHWVNLLQPSYELMPMTCYGGARSVLWPAGVDHN